MSETSWHHAGVTTPNDTDADTEFERHLAEVFSRIEVPASTGRWRGLVAADGTVEAADSEIDLRGVPQALSRADAPDQKASQ